MGYFRELPNVEYQDFLSDSISSQSYLTVKNLFRRNKLRDDLQNVFTVFDKYEIVEGARPDTVAEEYYGDSDLDWVVLITAGIINVRDEWPLSNQELYIFTENKYTIQEINSVHHYETTEVKDKDGRLILPAGKHVNNNFTIPKPDTSNEETATLNPVIGISNWEYEVRENNKKGSIYLLKKIYLQQFLNDMRDIMIYQQSSQRINDRLIKTENTKVSIPR
tara:strand:- start:227 stop:889 length:663 start_codon:yes stop_codon:yes gene_type:complete